MFFENCLENGLKYIIIENKFLDDTHFCFTFNKGSMSDLINYQGQSHFQEHLCFYKESNDSSYSNKLREFVRGSNGFINAYTNFTFWNIISKIKSEKFEKLIHLIYEVVKNPGLNLNLAKNEIYSIQEEHMFRNRDDYLNINYLIKRLNDKNSSYRKYLLGNFETLNILNSSNQIDINKLEKLINIIKENYYQNLSSNLMNIVIQTNLSKDIIIDILKDTFGNFVNKKLEIDYNFKNNPPFTKFERIIKYKPKTNLNYVSWIYYVDNRVKFNRMTYLFLRFLMYDRKWFFNNLEKNISNKLDIFFDLINEEFLVIEFRIFLTNFGVNVYDKPIKIINWFLGFIMDKSSELSDLFEEFKKIHLNEFSNHFYNLNNGIDLVRDLSKFLITLKKYDLNFLEYQEYIKNLKYEDLKKELIYLLEKMNYTNSNIFIISKFAFLDKKHIKKNKLLKYQYSINKYDKNLIKIFNLEPTYKEESETSSLKKLNLSTEIEIFEEKKDKFNLTTVNFKNKPKLTNKKEIYFNLPTINYFNKETKIENIVSFINDLKTNYSNDDKEINYFKNIVIDNNFFNKISFQIFIWKNQNILKNELLILINLILLQFKNNWNNNYNYDNSFHKFDYSFEGISITFYSWDNNILYEYVNSLFNTFNYLFKLVKNDILELLEWYRNNNFLFYTKNNNNIDYKSRTYMIEIIRKLINYEIDYSSLNINDELDIVFLKISNLKFSWIKFIISNNISNLINEKLRDINSLFLFNDCKEINNNNYTINLLSNISYNHNINKVNKLDLINSIGIYFQLENSQTFKFYEIDFYNDDYKYNFYLIYILKQTISIFFWNYIRFENKIGYYIYNEITLNNGIFGIIYFIESYNYNSKELENKIFEFLEKYINESTEETLRNNILSNLNEENNLDFIFTKDFNKNSIKIFENYLLFNFKEDILEFIEKIILKKLLADFYLNKKKTYNVYENSYFNNKKKISLNNNYKESIYLNRMNEIINQF